MKKIWLMLICTLLSLSLVSCGTPTDKPTTSNTTTTDGPKQGGTYIISLSGDPSTLNPDGINDDYNYQIAQNIFSRLVKLTNDYTVIPDLAKSWEVSEDALTYTFSLNENVTWHDGEAFSAEDVVFTYQTIVDSNYAQANVFANVASITAPDNNTVVFEMSQPDGSFLANIAWYGTFILPKHLLEGEDWLSSSFNDNPVGTGPFKFAEWNKGTNVQLARNDDYFGGVPYLDKVIYTIIPDSNTSYQAWLNGEVDEISGTDIPTSDLQGLINDTTEYQTMRQMWPSPFYLTFNLQEGPFSNPLVRLAVATGVNRDEVSTKAFNGFRPSNNYYIPEIYTDALNPEAKLPDYDTEAAMKLLEEAGYTKDADGYYFETTLKIMSGGFDDTAAVVVDNLDKIGIKVKLEVLDYNIWLTQVQDDYNFEITMLAGFQGPDVLGTGRRWTTTGTINMARYSNENVDQLFTEALQASSQEEVNDNIKAIQVYLAEDVPFVTLVQYADVQPFKVNIHGHPYFSEADGGSKEKAGFSELTYVWIED